jgi:hypothetical protein
MNRGIMLGDVGVFGPESGQKKCDLQNSKFPPGITFLGERETNLQNHLPKREKAMSIV